MRNPFWRSLPSGSMLLLAACIGDAEIINVLEEVATVVVAPNTETLRPGETRQLSATIIGENDMTLQRTPEWTSSDNNTATVSTTGLVTAVKVGPVTITASTGGKSGTSNIIVAQQPPTVVTLAATNVTSTSGEANGTVNPNGGPTTANFEWGTTAALGQTCGNAAPVGSGTTPQAFQCELGNILPGTMIHYRIIGENAGGISRGEILTFATLSAAPVVVTLPATAVTSSGGVANATVNPKGLQTTGNFAYGVTAALGSLCTPPRVFAAVDEELSFSCTFSNFTGGTTIFYRVFATNTGGTSTGETLSFRTLGATVQTLAADSITTNGGYVRGSVNPNDEPTATTLEFGSTAALGGRCTPDLQLPAANTVTTIRCRISPNAPGVTVFYRIWAQNASGTSRGAIMSFTTLTSGPSSVSDAAASRPMIEGIADRLIEAVQATGPLDAITSMPREAWWTSPSTPALITARMRIVEQR